jgi:hypothetical protein
MNKRLDTFGIIFVTFTVIFFGYGFYHLFISSWPNIPKLLTVFAFWLILSFMLIAFSIGIAKGTDRMKIEIPKKPAIVVFLVAGLLFLTAGILNGGI